MYNYIIVKEEGQLFSDQMAILLVPFSVSSKSVIFLPKFLYADRKSEAINVLCYLAYLHLRWMLQNENVCVSSCTAQISLWNN